jgi:hypothetical protein
MAAVRSVDTSMQVGCLIGYFEGFGVGAFTVASDRPDWFGAWWPVSSTFGEVQEWVNGVYAAPENRVILIYAVISLLQEKTAGTPQAQIDAQLDGERKVYAAARERDRAKAKE